MELNYEEIAECAVAYAQKSNIELDYSRESIEAVDMILGQYYEHLAEYDGETGADALWNIAVHFGIYLGETMLRLHLQEKGYTWYLKDGLPVLKNDINEMSPISKTHKRILNGPEDSVRSFCDVAFMIADGKFPTRQVHRVIDVRLASGPIIENVLYKQIESYIMLVAEGQEDFIILDSQDGFFQFYGIDDQFVAEIRVNLQNGDFHTYSIINQDKEHETERIQLTTPYGQYTPTEREVVSLDLIKTVARKYYENITEEGLLLTIPYIDTTEQTKRYMGLMK